MGFEWSLSAPAASAKCAGQMLQVVWWGYLRREFRKDKAPAACSTRLASSCQGTPPHTNSRHCTSNPWLIRAGRIRVENAARLGDIALTRLRALQSQYRVIGDVRGRGFLFGVELVLDRETKTPANDLAEAVFYRCLDKGLSFKISMGNTLTFTPPLILTETQLDFALTVIEESIAEECKLAGIDI